MKQYRGCTPFTCQCLIIEEYDDADDPIVMTIVDNYEVLERLKAANDPRTSTYEENLKGYTSKTPCKVHTDPYRMTRHIQAKEDSVKAWEDIKKVKRALRQPESIDDIEWELDSKRNFKVILRPDQEILSVEGVTIEYKT